MSSDPLATDNSTKDVEPPFAPEQAWLQAIFQRLERPLIAYVMRLLGGDLEASRDCVQEAFLRLCREHRPHVEGHVDAWLFKTCRNRAMDHHRREARMKVDSDSLALAAVSAPNIDPNARLEQLDEKERLRQLIDRLPQREQEVLSLRLNQGLSYKQIAEILDLSVSNVGVLLHQAITKLRTQIHHTDQPCLRSR
jgi:RNA polymerase sigma-70 factor (ECF subfamily)